MKIWIYMRLKKETGISKNQMLMLRKIEMHRNRQHPIATHNQMPAENSHATFSRLECIKSRHYSLSELVEYDNCQYNYKYHQNNYEH